MTSEPQLDDLAAELAALGRALPQPTVSAGFTDAVMIRLADAPPVMVPSRLQRLSRQAVESLTQRRRNAVIVVTVILLALLGTPAVRAAVAELFRFAGVSVRIEPTPAPSVTPTPPKALSTASLDEARRLVTFSPVVPAELGAPDGVEVSADHRLLSMSWTAEDGTVVRLDQFDARLDYMMLKTAPDFEVTTVGGADALWFDRPHDVVVLQPDGTQRTETARLAGRTLIWERSGTVLRLEGDVSRERAVQIAESARQWP